MKKILITGGAGFIGSNFIRYFLNKYSDHHIVNLDKLTYAGCRASLKDIEKNKHYNFVKGDICDTKIVEKTVKDCDIIIHFAAQTHVDRSIVDATEFIHTNVYGTYTLLEGARKNNLGKFIHVSTDEVYGSIENGFFSEKSSLNPNSPYAATKAAADLLVRSYIMTYGFPAIIIRPSNNFGPYQYPEKIISLFITNALENKKLPVYADGSNVREWLYVLDNCEAVDLVLQKGKIGEIYNIGGGNEKANLELTHLILKIMGKPKSLIKFVEDRPGHDKRYSLNCEKIKRLGWRPKYDFYTAIEATVKWYRDNEWWWKPLKVGVR